MLKRCMLVLAIIAALFGAPTNVSAAGNELSAAQAGPGSGTTATTFTFKVTYDGRFPATSVTTSVAGRTLAMSRVSGSPSSGTWSASTTLPAGTWPVTFSAVPERGNSPSLVGPTVMVTAAVTPPPSAPPKPPPKATPAPTPDAPPGDNTGTTVTTPQPAPGDSAPGDSAPGDSAPDDSAPGDGGIVPPRDDDATPAPGASDATGNPPDGGGAEPVGDGAPAATGQIAPSSEAAPAVGRTTSATDDDATTATDGLLNMVLLVGLSGVAAVALIGVAVMLAGRRRDHDDETAVPAAASFAARATRSSPEASPDAVMERRMLRQSRVRMTDDPIVAALGIGNDDDDRRRARRTAGQVSRGPGERPNISRN